MSQVIPHQPDSPDLQQAGFDLVDDFPEDQLQAVTYDGDDFLTPAAQAFAHHWALHRNKTSAYRHAYPSSSGASALRNARLMWTDPRIQAEIRRVINSWTEKAGVSLLQIERELGRVARSDLRRIVDAGGRIKLPHEWDADAAAAVSSYEVIETQKGRGEDRYTEVRHKIRLWDKHAAARTLAEMKGAFAKDKAPPGVQASFVINLGAGAQPLCGPSQAVTIDVDTTRKAKKVPKKAAPKKEAAKQKAIAAPRRGPLFGDAA
jgi:phage terminase small subunit